MEKVTLYILDTRKYTYNSLLSMTKLDEKELGFLDKYKVIDVKKEKLISYYFKKKYVGEYSLNEFGKPVSSSIRFNISDSKGIVVLAITNNFDIGVDIEVIRNKDEDLVKYVSSKEEYDFIKNEIDFFSIWTNKESLLKCLGTGIKNNIILVPSLPLNGLKEYEGKTYYSKIIKYSDAIISITLNNNEDFLYEIVLEGNNNE